MGLCSKHLHARGRIALSGGGLRPLKGRAAELDFQVFSKSGRNLELPCGQVKALIYDVNSKLTVTTARSICSPGAIGVAAPARSV